MKLAEAIQKAHHVYIIGNGGSYANAIHFCNDLLSVGIKAFTLDPSSLTAFANDHGYETAFSCWINIVGEEGDLLIALSGSGNSQSIVEAIRMAKSKRMRSFAITGLFSQTNAAYRTADDFCCSGQNMQSAEEYQLVLAHQCMRWLKDQIK